MDPSHIPDDIWTEIFELLPRRHLAANIQRICRRFRTLAANPLLRHVLWLTPAQIQNELILWTTRNANIATFPRSLCITPRLERDVQKSLWDSDDSDIPPLMVNPFLVSVLVLSAYIHGCLPFLLAHSPKTPLPPDPCPVATLHVSLYAYHVEYCFL
jgi:hypothetical protein